MTSEKRFPHLFQALISEKCFFTSCEDGHGHLRIGVKSSRAL